MNITLSVSGELESLIKNYKHIKWTEVARNAMAEEAIKLQKLEILQKYLEKREISDEEWAWMDKIDWHPVDEKNYKPEFVKRVLATANSKSRKIKNFEELFK